MRQFQMYVAHTSIIINVYTLASSKIEQFRISFRARLCNDGARSNGYLINSVTVKEEILYAELCLIKLTVFFS